MKIKVHDPMIHYPTLEICWEIGWQKFRRIAQIAQRTYFFGSVIFMNLFFESDFSWYLFFWVSQKIPGPSPPVMYMSEYTPWGSWGPWIFPKYPIVFEFWSNHDPEVNPAKVLLGALNIIQTYRIFSGPYLGQHSNITENFEDFSRHFIRFLTL